MPFSLGIEGEEWSQWLGMLVIPNPANSHHLLVTLTDEGYTVIDSKKWFTVDSALMAAAEVRNLLQEVTNETS